MLINIDVASHRHNPAFLVLFTTGFTATSFGEAMAFANANHFTMGDTQVNAIANQTNIHQSLAIGGDKDPLRLLLDHSAIDAMADSPSASYAPTCHPGTREAVTKDVMTWARDPKATPILWLSGPVGAGKSCIQRKVVQLCTDEGLYVACFFFSVKESETSSEARFITTLAAQLAENIPGLKWYIERAIKMDHRIFTRSLDSQAEGLIIKPLQALEDSMLNRLERFCRKTLMNFTSQGGPRTRISVIVIDGLDECVDEKEQAHILHLVDVLANQSVFPFRFVIASRPEYAIRTAFSSPPLFAHTRVLRLETYEADGDILLFMKAEFCRLRSNHPASKAIPINWPSTEDENALISKASGQFVFVSTVMKHLSNPRRNPVLELQHILDYRPSESNTNPFAELDALYNRILRQPGVNILLLKPILHAIIRSVFFIEEIEDLLDLAPEGEVVDKEFWLSFSLETDQAIKKKMVEDRLNEADSIGDYVPPVK
ncbi:hypothetical protein EST38_g320 [Candolleomyces aberdarensis]|uniref:Nephrocystin 3-like N-terminal domain-containing protein n=1 Tax=Candolleomyces aberdarensis TaxID=2316362 RepID=A0A4Q2E072_9AGAR|nr:hypothetical protein EST38_g320 [Candolleomyces aberdarensis]